MEKKYLNIIMEYKFSVGDNVLYDNDGKKELCFIFKHRSHSQRPTYLVNNLETSKILDQVEETSLEKTDIKSVVDYYWNNINYTGDNGVMSNYIVNNILKNIATTKNVIWGPNISDQTYTLKIDKYPAWIKNKKE